METNSLHEEQSHLCPCIWQQSLPQDAVFVELQTLLASPLIPVASCSLLFLDLQPILCTLSFPFSFFLPEVSAQEE